MENLLAILLLLAVGLVPASATPLSLDAENPHYFLFQGKPSVLIGSGEHYGAVLNLDFDYAKYLRTLAKDRLNLTRIWVGAYCEPPSAFNIRSNTLAPLPGRFICPWARSEQPGYTGGGNKFDINRWDYSYFRRLKDFMSLAARSGVVVELNLFCPFYEDSMWRLSPMNSLNNINAIGDVARTNVYTLDKSGGLLPVQERLVRKLMTELKGYDNCYYEICNEPYFGGVTLGWQHHIADVILQTEQGLGVHHLISQNIANGKARIRTPHAGISIFNFHYASPPDAVALNYGLNKVIGENETGFHGTNDAVYRMEAWDFIAAGGGLFNNLDYSFVAGREDGTFVYPGSQPGGGSPALRRQYRFLRDTINRFEFIRMRPDNESVTASLPPGASVRTLANPGREYLVYLRTGLAGGKAAAPAHFTSGELRLTLRLPQDRYTGEWFEPRSGKLRARERLDCTTAPLSLPVPSFEQDILLTVRKAE